MANTVSVPSIQQILIENECAKALIALARTSQSFVQSSGLLNRTDSTLAFDDANRRFTVAPTVNSYSAIVGGLLTVFTTSKSVDWAEAEGIHFFYLDSTGALKTTQDTTVWLAAFTNGGAGLAAIYWDATNNLSIRRIDERHGVEMPGTTHIYLHRYLGTQYESGGALSDFTITVGNATAANHAQFSVADAVVSDEDIRVVIANGSPQTLSTVAQIPIFYLSGSGVWRMKPPDAYPVIYSGTAGFTGTGRLAWNQLSGGVWTLEEVSNGNFVMVHYFLTTDLVEPVIGVQGQAIHTSVSGVREAANTEISTIIGLSKLLSIEKRALATVIFQTADVYSNVPKAKVVQTDTLTNYEDWRLERSLPV